MKHWSLNWGPRSGINWAVIFTHSTLGVLHVFVDLELFCLLDQHLFFLDVAEELVPLPLSLALHVPQVVFEPVVGGFTGAPIALVGMLSLLLHVGVDGVRAL